MRKLLNRELGRKSVGQFREADKSPFVIVLDNVRSGSNVGSVFRTADAFLAERIFLCGITACPPHRDVSKTALGATESVAWEYYRETLEVIDQLRVSGYRVIAIEQVEGAVRLQDFPFSKDERYAFVFGHEVHGVDQGVLDRCDRCLEIPQFGTKHSFNIAVSAGIVLWELFRSIHTKQ